MADRSQQKFKRLSKRLSKRLGEGAASFTRFRHLASAIVLFSLCVGCHLKGEKPGSIQFLNSDALNATPTLPKKFATQTSYDLQSIESRQNPPATQTSHLQAEVDLSKQESGVGLASYDQDDGSQPLDSPSSRRPELQLPTEFNAPAESDRAIKEAEAAAESEADDSVSADIADNANLADRQIPPKGAQTVNDVESVGTLGVPIDAVLQSTLNYYPEIQVVLEELTIANGGRIQAEGNFDTKFKIDSDNTPIGFYETYRNKFAVERPTFNGGSVFAGYRQGRGDFETWYLERNTNAGGELSFGGNWNLLRDRQIDARRVALWQSQIKVDAVEPVVHQQLLQTFRDAEIAYWNWVAAGQVYRRNLQLFRVAKNRVAGIEARIKAGDLADITRTDNDRTILGREVKLIKAQAKLDQAAIKLSLYYRDANGTPIIATESQLPEFDLEAYQVVLDLDGLVNEAVCCRPETKLLALDLQAISLDLAKAQNDLLPQLNASVKFSQDIGRPTSASAAASSSTQTVFVFFDEKDEFQVDLGVNLSQSLQLRKARGKIESLAGKQRQLEIKRQFVAQKITAEVQQNYQLTMAAKEQVRAAKQNLVLAQKLSAAARERIKSGDADLFEIILREQQELDAAIELVASQFAFFSNRANLNASVGCERYQSYGRFLQAP